MTTTTASLDYMKRRTSFWSTLYSYKEAIPGLLAMFFIAIFSNNLAGNPNPLTLENLFYYLDQVIGPVNGQQFFQILNSNFVWNAFLVGFLFSNIFGVPDSWKRGLSYIHKLMPLGIIMLAPHFIVGHASKAGWVAIAIGVFALFFTSTLTIYLSKFFKVDDRHGSDIAGALASGDPHVTAILMPLLKVKGGQVINAFTCVVLVGVIMSVIFPYVISLFGIGAKGAGLASVLTVGNGQQAFSAAFSVSYEAGRWARYYDVVRHVIMPASFIYVFAFMFIRKLKFRGQPGVNATGELNKVPPYLIVFIVLWIISCLYVFKEPAHLAIFEMVKWDFSLAAAALGLSLNWREIKEWGIRAFFLTFTAAFIRLFLVCGIIWAAFKFGLMA